ncbi:hypothetical protein J2741_001400 [Methanolinea mesophila]|uniref:hypothetical protein n=1 Tax=Methanolinea mesophila TaxID=547055 RepID=UPI001AE4D220|nr:hypothetical protein [Methanolinea mesophila]MBP1928853.1 hypothetical protein [Methanolinea mesophila]
MTEQAGMNTGEGENEAILSAITAAMKTCDSRTRRNLVDRVVARLFTDPGFARRFVDAGGVAFLVQGLDDPDEKIRLHTIHALSRLAVQGFGDELRQAGAAAPLAILKGSDPYEAVRDMAGHTLQQIL